MQIPHDLTCETYQWGKVRGGQPSDALTRFHCTKCQKGFAHRYNIQPDIYQAAADEGFDLHVCAADGLTKDANQFERPDPVDA